MAMKTVTDYVGLNGDRKMSNKPVSLFLSIGFLLVGATAQAQITPAMTTLGPSQQQQFSLQPGEEATWQVVPEGSGTITSTGLYTAPPVYAATYAWVYARSLTPLTAGGEYYWRRATVNLSPAAVGVSVSPATATIAPAGTQQFSVKNLPSGTSVAWSVSPVAGSITPAGLYTAPSSVAAQTTITVMATNSSTNSVLGTASLILQASPPTSVSPATATVAPPGTQQFSVQNLPSGTSVAWSVSPVAGSITPAGLYTAPSSVAAQHNHYGHGDELFHKLRSWNCQSDSAGLATH